MVPQDILLPRLEGVRQIRADRWYARCPAHADKSPSLSIRISDTGTLLVHCFAGCLTEDVLAAVGLSWSALFPDDRLQIKSAYHQAVHHPVRSLERERRVLDPMVLERRIIWIARERERAGGVLTLEDRARLELALERVGCAYEHS